MGDARDLGVLAVRLGVGGLCFAHGAQKLFGWAVSQGGQLTPVGEFGGVPGTVAGLAAS